jgi:hypothetical protein
VNNSSKEGGRSSKIALFRSIQICQQTWAAKQSGADFCVDHKVKQSEMETPLQEKGREKCLSSRFQTSLVKSQCTRRWWMSSEARLQSRQIPGPSQPLRRSMSQERIFSFPASQIKSLYLRGIAQFHSWRNHELSAPRFIC